MVVKKVIKTLHALLVWPLSGVLTKLLNLEKGWLSGFKGYYDIQLRSQNGQYKFGHIGNLKCHALAVYDEFDQEVERFPVAWNMQQGSRATWCQNTLFFNSYNNGSVRTMSFQPEKRLLQEFDQRMLQSINDELVIFMDYGRVTSLRPDYGYSGLQKTGSVAFEIVRRADNIVLYSEPYQGESWVNHFICWGSRRVVYVERRMIGNIREDQLISLTFSGNSVEKKVLVKGMVSHYCFKDSSNLIVFMKPQSKVKTWYSINLDCPVYEEIPELYKFGDGHPTMAGRLLCFDTYPNNLFRTQSLYIWDFRGSPKKVLTRHIPPSYRNELRCDFHPVINGEYIYFDSVCSKGKRIIERVEW